MNIAQDPNDNQPPIGQESLIFVDSSLAFITDSLAPPFSQQLYTYKDINDITFVLSREQNLDSIHIFSEGNSGFLELGETRLNNENLSQYSQDLSIWGQALSDHGDILFYGCNVGQGKSGEDFLTNFASLTGRDIAASDDLTGNSSLGGDWDLEVATGEIETSTITTPSLINSFSSVLLSSQIAINTDSKLVTFTGNLQDNSLYLSVDQNNLISYSFNGLDFDNIDTDSTTQGIQGLSISTFLNDSYGFDINLDSGNDNLIIDYSLVEAIALQSFNSIEDTSNLTLQNINTSWNLFDGEGFIDFNWEIFDSTDNSTFTDGYSGIIGFSGIEGFTGGIGKDNFILNQDFTTNIYLDGGLGENSLTGGNLDNNWTITGVNGGNVNSNVTFVNVSNLTGGLGDDEFVFEDGGSITGTIDGGSEGYFDYTTASSVIEIKGGDRIINDDGKIYEALTPLSIPTATGNEFTDEDTPTIINVGDRIVIEGANVFEALATITPEGDATTLDLTDETQEYFNNENWRQITIELSDATINYANNSDWQEVTINGDTVSFNGYSDGITVDLETSQITSNGNVITQFANFENLIGSNSNNDELKGKAIDSTWHIIGNNQGKVTEINFSSFENLTGADNVDDFFLFDGGNIHGVIDGGLNGDDNFGVKQNDGTMVIFNEYTNSEVDQTDAVTNWFGVNINYANLDANQTVIFDNVTNSQIIKGTNANDNIIISNSSTQGEIEIKFEGRFLADSSGNQVADIRRINDFSQNLVIELKNGDDNLTIQSFDPTFNKDLTIKGQGDEDFVNITGDVFLNGGDLNINAEKINIDKGVIVSTRQVVNGLVDRNNHITDESVANSGNITLAGKIIDVGVNGNSQEKAQLLSHVHENSVLSQGDISLEVIDDIDIQELLKSNIPILGIRDSKAEITLDQVNIQGGLVNLSAIASHNNDVRITDLGYGEFNFNFLPDIGLPNNPIFPVTTMGFFAGVSISKATANLTMTENSSVTASEFQGSAVADGNAIVSTTSIGVSTQIGILTTKANVNIQGDIIVTNGNLSLNALTKNTISVMSANPLLGLLPTIADVSISILNSDSIINVGHQSNINVLNGNFTAYADTVTTNITSAISNSGNGGRLGLAFALSMETKTTNVFIDGNVTANGNIDIVANQTKDLFNLQDSQVSASAGASLNRVERRVLLRDNIIFPIISQLNSKTNNFLTKTSEKMKGQSLPFRFSAATAFTQEENNVNARIGDGVNTNQVTSSNGFVNVNSVINSRPDVSTTSSIAATREFIVVGNSRKLGKIDYNDAKFTGTTAIAIGLIENNANAYINTGAKVDASQDLTVKSETINDYQNNFGVNLVEPFTQDPNFSSDEGEKEINLGNIVKVASNHDKGGSHGHYYQYIGGNSGSIINLSQEDFSDANLWQDLGAEWHFRSSNFLVNLGSYFKQSGLDANLADSWTQSVAEGSDLNVAGAVTYLDLHHNSNAYIAENAQINQNTSLRSQEQNVQVESISINEGVHLGGNIKVDGLKFVTKLTETKTKNTDNQNSVGVIALRTNYNNDVSATIGDGVQLYADSLNVSANNKTLGISVAAAGAKSLNVGKANLGAGSDAGAFGFQGTASVIDVNNTTYAQIHSGANITVGDNVIPDSNSSVVVNAHDKTEVFNIAGSVLSADNIGVGASIIFNNINRDTQALIGNFSNELDVNNNNTLSSQGKITITANNTGLIHSYSAAAAIAKEDPTNAVAQNAAKGGGTYGVGISGSVAINTINSDAKAYISDAVVKTIVPSTDLVINAITDTDILAVTGSVAFLTTNNSYGGLAGAYSHNIITGKTQAFIDNSNIQLSGNLDINAETKGTILAIGASGSGSTTSANAINVAGQVMVNDIDNDTETFISNDSVITANNLTLNSKDESQILAIAGALSYGGRGGFGSSIAVNTIDNDVNAYVLNSDVTATGNISLNGTQDKAEIISVTAAIGASKTGMAGAISYSYNNISNTTQTYIQGVQTSGVQALGDISLIAQDDSYIRAGVGSYAGSLALFPTNQYSFGGAFATNEINNNLNSFIDDSVVKSEQGEVKLESLSTSDIQSYVVAISMATSISISTSVALNEIDNDNKTYISNSKVDSKNDLKLKAKDESKIDALTGGSTASVSVNQISNNTHAYIVNSNKNTDPLLGIDSEQSIVIEAIDDSDIQSLSGQVAYSQGGANGGIAFGAASATNKIDNSTLAYVDNSTLIADNEVLISSTSTSEIQTLSAGLSASSQTAVAGGLSVNIINNTISAYTTNSSDVQSVNNISIIADDNSTIKSLAGQISAGIGSVGIGGAVAYNQISNDILAYSENSILITTDGTVNGENKPNITDGNILIQATAEGTIETVAVGGSGGGTAGLAGSVAINETSNTILAYVNNSNLTAGGSIGVVAHGDTKKETYGGALGGGGSVGFGGSAVVNNLDNTVNAYIDNSNVTALGNQAINLPSADGTNNDEDVYGLGVIATNTGEIEVLTGSAAGGGSGGLQVTLDINSISDRTQAWINGGDVDSEKDIHVKAFNDTDIDVKAGGLAVGGTAGAGGTIDFTTIKNRTEAYITQGTTVDVTENLDVQALGQKNTTTGVVAASGGFNLGISGAVALLNIGSNLTEDGIEASGEARNLLASQLNQVDTMIEETNTNSDILEDFNPNALFIHGTTAYIGGNITVEGNIIINATETTQTNMTAGGLGGAILGGAVGAGVGIANITQNVNAYIENNSVISADGNIIINSVGKVGNENNAIDVNSYAGAGGAGALGAAVSLINIDNDGNAYIGDNAIINKANDINILSDTDTHAEAQSVGGAAGGVAIGALVTEIDVKDNTNAYVGSNAQIGNGTDIVKNLTVNADGLVNTTQEIWGGGYGVYAGAGARLQTNHDTSTIAEIRDGAIVNVTENIDIDTIHDSQFNGEILTGTFGTLAGSGAEIDHNITSDVQGNIGNGAIVTANNIDIYSNNKANKEALGKDNLKGVTGGKFSAAGANSDIRIDFETVINIDDNSNITTVNDLNLNALNELDIYEKITFQTGGALSGAGADLDIKTVNNLAQINIGNANIETGNDLNISARGNGNVIGKVNTDTFGLGTVGYGNTNVEINPVNEVIFNAGANVTTYGDVNISTGKGVDFIRDQYKIEAYSDNFAGSVIPLNFIDAKAELKQDNEIIVNTGAIIQTAGNVKLYAEDETSADMKATAKAINWGTAIINAINGSESSKGTIKTDINGNVQIDGTVKTGIRRNQHIIFESLNPDNTVNVSLQTDGITYRNDFTTRTSKLREELTRAQSILNELGGQDPTLKNYYEAEIARIQSELNSIGLLSQDNIQVAQIVLSPIEAIAGFIDVRAKNLTGNGVLDAPGDASVTIENRSSAFLLVDDIFVSETNGGVMLNGITVTDNQFINELNQSATANFATITDVSTGNDPSITITSNHYQDPALTIVGQIENIRGEFVVDVSGDYIINQGARVVVKDQKVKAGGSVLINGLSKYDVGGEAYARWNTVTNNGTRIASSSGINSILSQVPTNISLFADSIIIDAQYIDVNGIIQSGVENYALTLAESTNDEIEAIIASGSSGRIKLNSINSTVSNYEVDSNNKIKNVGNADFDVFFNTITQEIEIEPLRVSGGKIELSGHVMNTGNGEIRLLGGYGNIQVNNNTAYDLVIKELDASQRGTGTLFINDKAKGYSTLYKKDDNGVTVEINDNVTNGTDIMTYTPQSGYRYAWSMYTKERKLTTTIYQYNEWLFGWFGDNEPDNQYINSVNTETLEGPTPSGKGPYYYQSNNNDKYTYSQKSTSNTVGNNKVDQWDSGPFYNRKRNEKWVKEQIIYNNYTHTIEADRPFGIKFIGYDEATVTVNSDSDVIIAGQIRNNTGTTTVNTQGEIIQRGDTSSISGKEINLTAQTGIGADGVTLNVNLTEDALASLTAITNTGDIVINELSDDLKINQVTTNIGDVKLSAPDSIEVAINQEGLIKGGNIELTALAGSIGNNPSQKLQLNSGEDDNNYVNLQALDNIYVSEITGDLRVKEINARLGDVYIDVKDGSLLDANEEQVIDERTTDELLNGVWTDLQLTAETGANDKIQNTINEFAQVKEQEYQTYWRYRNSQPNPDVYDENFTVSLTELEENYYRNQLGYDDSAIEALELNITEQYHDLHNQYGSYGDVYNENFTYTPSTEEEDQIRSNIKIWTEDELLNLVSGNIFAPITDTQTTIEDPNITAGGRVQILTNGSVGNDDGVYIINDLQNLTDDEKVLLAAAEREDITFLGGNIISATVDFVQDGEQFTIVGDVNWASQGLTAGMAILITGNTDNVSDSNSDYYTIASLEGNTIILDSGKALTPETQRNITIKPTILDPLNVDANVYPQGITSIEVALTEDIDLNVEGNLKVTATEEVYISSEQDITIENIIAGKDARVRSTQNIIKGVNQVDDSVSNTITGQSLVLDGINDYVSIKIDVPETEVTHEFWFRTTDANTGLFSITNQELGANGHDREIYLSNGNIHARLWNNVQIISSTGLNLADGQWHHVAHVFGASIGGQKLYINGEEVASGTKTGSDFTTQDRIQLGFSAVSQNKYLNGEIDEVRIWNKARGALEIKQTYNQPLTGKEEGLIGYWNFNYDNPNNLIIQDITNNGNNGKLYGNHQQNHVISQSLPLENPSNQPLYILNKDRIESYNPNDFESYGNQDKNGIVEIINDQEIKLIGNTWKAVDLDYNITDNSVLSFEFKSNNQGDIHGIGLDTDKNIDGNFFNLSGSNTRTSQVLSVDGVDDYVEVNYNSSLNPQQFTISAWVKVTGGQGTFRSPLTSRGTTTNGYLFYATERNKWAVWTGNGTWTSIETSDDLVMDKWTHLAATYNGSQLVFYVDGKLVGSRNTTFVRNTTQPLRIGAGRTEGTPLAFFPGQIDEVQVWNYARSESNIRETINQTLTGNENGLVGYWNFDNDTPASTTINDLSINNNDGRFVNAHINNIVTESLDRLNFDPQGILDYRYTGNGEWQTIEIPLSDYYQGKVNYLAFINNHDVTNPTAESQFRNIRIYEKATVTKEDVNITFNSPQDLNPYGNNQDVGGEVTINNPNEVELTGNLWKTVDTNYEITPETVLTFDFKSNSSGEIQGIGIDADNTIDGNFFNLSGYGNNIDTTKVLSFDGKDDYVLIDHDESLSLSTFTIETWVNLAEVKNTWQPLITKQANDGSQRNYGIFIQPNSTKPHVSLVNTANQNIFIDSQTSLNLNNWNHLAMTYDGSQLRLYINGVLDRSINASGMALQNLHPVKLGKELNAFTPFKGSMDEVRIWNYARSDSDISNNFQSTLTSYESGLVGYWNFEQDNFGNDGVNSDNLIQDVSGNSNNGVFINGKQPHIVESRKGVLQLDGFNDYVSYNQLLNISGDYTLEGWFNSGSSNHQTILAITNESDSGHYALVELQNGQLRFLHRAIATTSGGNNIYSPTTLNSNQWYHFAVVKSNTDLIMYLDGNEVARLADNTSFSDNVRFTIGRLAPNNGVRAFNGKLDEIRIWDQARTELEIKESYTKSLTGNEAGLTGYWNFDSDSADNNIINDSTPNGNNGTFINGTNNHIVVYGENTDSDNVLSLDGGNDYVDISSVNLNGLPEFTLEGWINLRELTKQRYDLFGQNDAIEFFISKNGSGYYELLLYTRNGGTLLTGSLGSDFQVNKWYHVAAVGSRNSLAIYLNGELLGQRSINVSSHGNSSFLPRIGQGVGANDGQGYFKGLMDEVRIWNKARTQIEINNTYNQTLTGNEAGLIGYWNFNNDHSATTLITDQSNNNHHGQLINGQQNHIVTNGANYDTNQSISFDGVNDYVNIGKADKLGLMNQSFTVEARIKVNAFNGGDETILGTDQGSYNQGLHLVIRNKRAYMGFFGNDTSSSLELQLNQWYNITWVYDKDQQRQLIYVDGNLVGSATGKPAFQGTGDVLIGRWGSAGYFNGEIDELKIWNSARTNTEINQTLKQKLSGNEEGLTGYWNFDNDSYDSLRIEDLSINGNHGIFNNGQTKNIITENLTNIGLNIDPSEGILDYRYTGNGEWQTIEIPIGKYYQGEINYLTFINDQDIVNPTANIQFRNITLSETPINQSAIYTFDNFNNESNLKVNGDLVLEASNGSVGTTEDKITIDLEENNTLTARAGDNIYLVEQDSDINLNTIFAKNGEVYLETQSGSILDNNRDNFVNISANGLTLVANQGSIGNNNNALELDLTNTAIVNAQAEGNINLTETQGNMNVGTIHSLSADVALLAHLSILDGENDLEADIIGNNITLQATLGNLGVSGNDLDIDTAYSATGTLTATSGENSYLIETNGDLAINTVTTGEDNTAFIFSGNKILNGNTEDGINIKSGKTKLFAGGDIGEADNPITAEIGFIEANSPSGDISIENKGHLTIGSVSNSANGIVTEGNVTIITRSPVTIDQDIIVTGEGNNIIIVASDDDNDGTVDTDDTITVKAGVTVKAEGGNVYFFAGDNIIIEQNAVIETANDKQVFFYSDYNGYTSSGLPSDILSQAENAENADVGGGNIDIQGKINSSKLNIYSGNEDDTIEASTVDIAVMVDSGEGDDIINTALPTINLANVSTRHLHQLKKKSILILKSSK